jgi:cell division septation protein DedD
MTTDVRDARSLPEEGFHEIQLSGKQLVFLFMATTVVSVVIFLCGVLVGRGVRPATTVDAAAVASTPEVEGASPATDAAPAATPPADAPPSAEQPPSYYSNLVAETPPAESVAPAAEPEAEARPGPPPAAAADTTARAADARPASTAQAEQPWIVQVTALKKRGEAQAIATRLASRGYKAYVLDPQPGSTVLYRVRVGPFADRADAEQIVKRLTSEEQFKPWISR